MYASLGSAAAHGGAPSPAADPVSAATAALAAAFGESADACAALASSSAADEAACRAAAGAAQAALARARAAMRDLELLAEEADTCVGGAGKRREERRWAFVFYFSRAHLSTSFSLPF